MSDYRLTPIGYITSCFPEKFGIPRQPLLAPSAKAYLSLIPPFNDPDAVAGLESVSHLWLHFIFHQHTHKPWKPKVRPPRLGGNQKLGVFATRSSFRPNHLGLSVVKLEGIVIDKQEVVLQLSGVDLLDGTPIVDIKPYVPYADSIASAVNDIADVPPEHVPVSFSQQAAHVIKRYYQEKSIDLHSLIVEVLQQDPRPAYQAAKSSKELGRVYGMSLYDCNIQWRYDGHKGLEVIEVLQQSV